MANKKNKNKDIKKGERTQKEKKEAVREKPERLPYGKNAYIVQAIGLVVGIIGFVLVGIGEITISVILLVLGFVILLPVGLWMRGKKKEQTNDKSAFPQ